MPDDTNEQLQALLDEEQTPPGLVKLFTPEGDPYYVPIGLSPQQPELPIPPVSLPDVPKEPPPTPTALQPDEIPIPVTAPAAETPPEPPPEPTPEFDPFAAIAAAVRRRAPARPPEEEPPEPPSDRDPLEFATAPERMGLSKVLEQPGKLFYGIPAALTELLAGIEEKTPRTDAPISSRRVGGLADFPQQTTMRDAAEYLKALAAGTEKFTSKVTGTEGQKPKTPLEKAGLWTGEYVTPMKGVSAVATTGLAVTGAAIRGGLTKFGPEDVPIVTQAGAQGLPKGFGAQENQPPGPPVRIAPAQKAPVRPAPLAPGTLIIPTMPNVPLTQQPAPEKPAKKELKHKTAPYIPEGMIIPPRDMRTTAPPNIKQGKGRARKDGTRTGVESDEDFAQRYENAWIFKEIQARLYSPSALAMFESVNGMQRMQQTEYKAIIGLGAGFLASLAVGILLSKPGFQKFFNANIPNFRSVENAAPGTAAISIPTDLARAYDDINAPLTRIARRAGIDPTVVSRLAQTFRIQTRNGARALADSAINEGVLTTPVFRFSVQHSLKDMARRSTPETDQYLKLLQRRDQLIAERNTAINKAVEKKRLEPEKGTVYEARKEASGTSQEITEIEKQIKDMEAGYPGIDQMGQANRDWNKALVDFRESAGGEYGTLTKEQANELRMSHTNTLGGKTTEDAIIGQADKAKALIKERLDNEAVGKYVDEMRKADERLFVKITKEELVDNPEWKNNVVSFLRNGEREYYTTDRLLADVLKTDHHMITGVGGNVLYGTKKLLEATTTGNLAPHFSVTSALRSYWIAKFTTEEGFKAPTAIGSVMAIPQQLIPQIAKSISNGLDRGSGGMLKEIFETGALGQTFGSAWIDGLSKRLAVAFEESVYAQLKATGSHKGSILEQQHVASSIEAATKWFDKEAATSNTVRGAQHFWNAWKASIEAVHSSVSFNYVKRNLGKEDLSLLSERARRLTGDPRTGGELFTSGRKSKQEITFEAGENGSNQAVLQGLVKGYGYTMDAAREAIPWWNPTLQGVKRIGEAYLHDPIRFHRSAFLYAMAPAASLFYYAKSLDAPGPNGEPGGDPHGRSYVDYCMNGRSSYNRQMNFCVPVPGRPVEDSREITFFHELNPFKRAAEIAFHHLVGNDFPNNDFIRGVYETPNDHLSAKRSLREDLWIAAHAFLDTAVIPPMPPLVNASLGLFGIRGPQGVFGGEAFTPKKDPFNQNGGLPNAVEITSRALMGGVAEALGAFYANATQTESGILDALKNGALGVRDVYVKKTPLLRDYTHILPDRSNNTDMAKEVFDNQKEFNDLSRFFKKWTINEGRVNVKGASTPGDIAVQEQFGLQKLSPGNPGRDQPPPKNPLYIEYMQEFYNSFAKESPLMVKGVDQGGSAFKSLWRNYGTATQKLDRLKNENYGSFNQWQREMDDDARDELKRNGVDTTDLSDVRNFYRRMQYDALRVINYVDRAVNKKMSEKAGRPITLKDIRPYDVPSDAPFMYPDLLD